MPARGERIAQTVVQEIREQAILEVEVTGIVGILGDPRHVIDHADGELLELDICLAAKLIGDRARRPISP